jgi:hypothetical protein
MCGLWIAYGTVDRVHFFTDAVFAAATRAGQFMFGPFVDNFEALQVGGQRLAFATARGWSDDFFLYLLSAAGSATLSTSLKRANAITIKAPGGAADISSRQFPRPGYSR